MPDRISIHGQDAVSKNFVNRTCRNLSAHELKKEFSDKYEM